jgi:hypothetical protein
MIARKVLRSTLGLLCRIALAAAAAMAAGCNEEPVGHPPVARIGSSPSGILSSDNFQTVISLDGTGSNDPLDDPEGDRPLQYQWEFRGDEFRIDSGDQASGELVVRFRGSRPPTIELTVTDEDGLENVAVTQLTVTIP